MMSMNVQTPLNLNLLSTKLRQWQARHNTPEKVAAAHRQVLRERVIQSMAFENQPLTMDRLEALLETPPKS
jgi:hypothetical protein